MSPSLRVSQLNIGSLLEPRWDERRHEILAWLDRLDPDIVCFQEVWENPTTPNTAGWLVDHAPAGRWHWCFGGFAFPAQLSPDPELIFGSAILSRWPVDDHALTPLPVDTEATDPFRRMQFELLHARTHGIDVFSTHLSPPPAHAHHRIRQVRCIDEVIERQRDPGATLPAILCGDFNAEPNSDEIRFLSSLAVLDGRSTYFQDAWRAAGRTDAGFTQDGRTNPIYRAMHLPPKRIDYVFVGDPFGSPDGAGLVEHAELAFHEPLTGVVASDHFGLVVDIRWPQRTDEVELP
jgi:endonuclease/exonuclease/phosphatase family metal-dependent hydrolase